ncbi:MAG: extracellular matrix regulator RemB [Acutalibacteraceae bacterium]
MFLHLGENTVISSSEIIGIFDMDNTTVSKATRDYLSKMQKDKKIIDVSLDLPKSFVLCKDRDLGENVVYISPISTQTLLKRIQNSKID